MRNSYIRWMAALLLMLLLGLLALGAGIGLRGREPRLPDVPQAGVISRIHATYKGRNSSQNSSMARYLRIRALTGGEA